MIALYIYIWFSYLLAAIAADNTKHMPWFMFIIAPCSVPITIAFIYCKALDGAFGE